MSLQNKVALITGAASGVGQATAIHFASLGAKLSLVDISPDFEETLKQCYEKELTEDRVLTQTVDVTDLVGQQELVNKTVERFGQLDILINCAGLIGIEQNLENFSMEYFDKIMDINFKAWLRLIQICTPHLKKTKGSVVNVSSRSSTYVYPYSLTYSVSKSAVDQLTRFAAQQLAPFGIRVNSVNPGPIKTNIIKTLSISREEWIQRVESFNRFADPMEIAKPIAFLASDDASFINGVQLLVDGGRFLNC